MFNLSHRCTSCGGSCQGVNVRLLDQNELAKVENLGVKLGIQEPVVGSRLRQTLDGRCVFLDKANLCRLHAHFGAESKPMICRQYPLVRLETESGERWGIDPGCYSAFASRQIPEQPSQMRNVVPTKIYWDANEVRLEQMLMGALNAPGQSVEGVIALLSGATPKTLPSGFSQRLVHLLSVDGVRRASQHASAGPSVRLGLAPMLESLPIWANEGVPNEPLTKDEQDWGLEVTRRLLWLRLCPGLPSPMLTVLLGLCGVLVAKWSNQNNEDGFSLTMAAWARGIRSPLFWSSLFPDPNAPQRLLKGP